MLSYSQFNYLMLYYPYMITQRDEKARKELGNMLKEAREKAKLTQAEVATKSEVSVNYYARVERGGENPTFEILDRIFKTLKIKIKL